MDPRYATADTELLGDPTCRRFLMSLWEIGGGTLTVTPAVADELPGNVRRSEGRHWRRVLRYDARHRNHRYDDETYRAIIEATKEAAGRWIAAELAGQGAGGLTAAHPSMDTDEHADEIEARIPRECFRRPDNPSQRADRRIVAEAAALGYTLLATENLGTIKHERTNEWLIRHGHTEGPLIVTVGEAARALHHPTGKEEAALNAVLGAALPDHDRGIERDLRAITAFIERLQSGHAQACAVWAADAMEVLERPAALIARMRERLPVRTRRTEANRVARTRQAASAAGYLGL